jgi:pyruvate dehydrogenase E1 component alpha subunit
MSAGASEGAPATERPPTASVAGERSERRSAMFQVLDPEGIEVGPVPKALSDDDLVAMLRLCIFGREFDKKAISLQRRGKLGTFAPMSGQEAVVVGSVFALDRDHDWIVPQYREQLAMLHWGLELSTYFLQRQGHPRGSDLPAHGRLFPQQVALAAHLPHAVGVAWGMKLKGEPSVAACYFGDGASSEGDFHESLNLAGVVKAPVIFVCQNNQWAISTPLSKQTAGVIAQRAAGYGIPGVRVDGNDPLAVYQVTADARARALAGDGPTLIEAITYRLGAHTTADDPTRYVDPDEEQRWKARDPLIRFRAWMRATGRWDDASDGEASAWCAAEIDRAVEQVAAVGPAAPELLFDNVYAEEPAALAAQRAELLDGLGES